VLREGKERAKRGQREGIKGARRDKPLFTPFMPSLCPL